MCYPSIFGKIMTEAQKGWFFTIHCLMCPLLLGTIIIKLVDYLFVLSNNEIWTIYGIYSVVWLILYVFMVNEEWNNELPF